MCKRTLHWPDRLAGRLWNDSWFISLFLFSEPAAIHVSMRVFFVSSIDYFPSELTHLDCSSEWKTAHVKQNTVNANERWLDFIWTQIYRITSSMESVNHEHLKLLWGFHWIILQHESSTNQEKIVCCPIVYIICSVQVKNENNKMTNGAVQISKCSVSLWPILFVHI